MRGLRAANGVNSGFAAMGRGAAVAAVWAGLAGLLGGCGFSGAASSASSMEKATALAGQVHGGQQPVSGASVVLYGVGTTGDGSAATSLMQYNSQATTVTTDSNGVFVLTNKYTCPGTPTQTFLVVTGGNPGVGGGTNPQLSLMTGLGLCSSLPTTYPFINVNEITTVATVAALQPFMTSATNIGSGSSDASTLAADMALIPQYVNIATGLAPGPALSSGYSASTPALVALANSISSCVNSTGGTSGDGSACGTLFANVQTAAGVPPADVIGATLDVLTYPYVSSSAIAALFSLATATPVFSTTQSTAPSTWALPIYQTTSTTSINLQHSQYTVAENAGSVAVTFQRNYSTSGAVSVNYTLYNGTAVAGTDFPMSSGTVSWADGNNTPQTLNIPIYNPGKTGGGDPHFYLVLNNPVNALLVANYQTSIFIQDTDSPLVFTTTALMPGTPNSAYSQTIAATGGVGTLTYSLASGSNLPNGLTLNSNGTISGTPTGTSTGNVTFVVTDQATPTSQTAQLTLLLVVASSGTAYQNALLAYQVSQLPTDTPMNAIKKAFLQYGVTLSSQLTTAGQSTAAANLLTDVQNDMNVTFTMPTTLPANLFPALQGLSGSANGTATNPFVTAEVSTLNTKLSTDLTSPIVYPYTYSLVDQAGTDLQLAQQMMWALMYSGQPLYQNPNLVPSILARMESGTYTLSSMGPDFTTTWSSSLLYMMLTQGWPQLVFPSRQAVWLSYLTAAQNTVVNGTTGTHLAAGPNDVGSNWINADVKWLEGVAYASMILNSPQTAIVQGGLAEMKASILPDGGTNYVELQNESCTYHQIFTQELARFSLITQDASGFKLPDGTTASSLAAQTKNYFPLSLGLGNVCEFITAPANKKYWNEQVGGAGQAVIVGQTSDPYNNYQLINTNYSLANGFDTAYFWNPSASSTALPSSWITYDANAMGPRGSFANSATSGFSFMSSTRNVYSSTYAIGAEGLPTFVGGILVDSTSPTASWALNSAVERIGNTVNYKANYELNLTDGSFADLAANQQAAQTTTSTFGAVTTVHNLHGYKASATSWKQTETWVLLPTRVIGLASMVNTSSETAYQLEGAVHFVSGVSTQGAQKTLTQLNPTTWAYTTSGATQWMVWQVFSHNYATITTEYSSTFGADGANKASNILLNDLYNSAATTHVWPAGTSHYFFSEFRPSTSAAAVNPTVLTGLPTGLVGFSFTDTDVNSTSYTIVHNPTASPISYAAPTGTVYMSGAQYRAVWIGGTSVSSATYAGTIPAYSHIVIVH